MNYQLHAANISDIDRLADIMTHSIRLFEFLHAFHQQNGNRRIIEHVIPKECVEGMRGAHRHPRA
jgi:hypothetical protein